MDDLKLTYRPFIWRTNSCIYRMDVRREERAFITPNDPRPFVRFDMFGIHTLHVIEYGYEREIVLPFTFTEQLKQHEFFVVARLYEMGLPCPPRRKILADLSMLNNEYNCKWDKDRFLVTLRMMVSEEELSWLTPASS